MLDVRLFPGLPGGRWARLGPLTGEAEQNVDPEQPEAFSELLDELLVECADTSVRPGMARNLAVADHDRIAAELYCDEYGPRVESAVRCRQCRQEVSLSFDLGAWIRPVSQIKADGVEGPDDSGYFKLLDGPRFRLPTVRDQLEIRTMANESARRELLKRCVAGDLKDAEQAETVECAMEALGPLISGKLTTHCPHCKFADDSLEFSIQRFFIEALAFEKHFFHQEVHLLARAYSWSRAEILAMSKRDRRVYARLLLSERASR